MQAMTQETIPAIVMHDSDTVFAATTYRGEEADTNKPYSGFSICHYTSDNPGHYMKCLDALASYLGTDINHIIVPRQTHTTNVHTVTACDIGLRNPDDCDAVVTSCAGVTIGVNTADCVPMLLYDETAGVIGAAHAGWRGAIGGIISNTLAAMEKAGAKPEQVHAIICPAICVDCFEVGEEVAECFPSAFVKREYGTRPHVNLPGYVIWCLENAGLLPANIISDGTCTRCNPDRFFSARAAGIQSGRNFSFIRLKHTV